MSKRVTTGKTAATVLAAVMALSAATPVLAQPAGPYTAQSSKGYYYDPCRRDTAQRGTIGGLLGGLAGAAIGSNVAARNARTEGAVLGGLVGVLAGSSVGNKTAACRSENTSNGYSQRVEAPYYGRDAYADTAAAPTRDDGFSRDDRGDRYRLSDRATGADGCTLAESPIYMPDGRTQTRFVRVCRDASGKYAVVD
ncbi:MAG: glycine zipper 2TM domain-containing protein [Alphaproteobacteria bacterium]